MIKTNTPGAIAALQELLATLPTDQDARSDFFINWKKRAVQTLEVIFQDDPQPSQQFNEIEFSPRRLTNHEARDNQLKLDAYLAGCAAARTLLESFLWRLSSAEQPAVDTSAPLLTVSRLSPDAAPPNASAPAAQPAVAVAVEGMRVHPDYAPDPPAPVKPIVTPETVAAPVPAREPEKIEEVPAASEQRDKSGSAETEPDPGAHQRQGGHERETPRKTRVRRERPRREGAERENDKSDPEMPARGKGERANAARVAAEAPVIAGASMNSDELCAPVRGSLSRMLSAWERGDRETATVVSAQLLADLSILAHQERFKAAFASVVSRAFTPETAEQTLQTLKTAGPLCVWSVLAAINEVMKK